MTTVVLSQLMSNKNGEKEEKDPLQVSANDKCVASIDLFNAGMELRNIILITIAGFTLSYARW